MKEVECRECNQSTYGSHQVRNTEEVNSGISLVSFTDLEEGRSVSVVTSAEETVANVICSQSAWWK